MRTPAFKRARLDSHMTLRAPARFELAGYDAASLRLLQ
jgi:hypothetical protein